MKQLGLALFLAAVHFFLSSCSESGRYVTEDISEYVNLKEITASDSNRIGLRVNSITLYGVDKRGRSKALTDKIAIEVEVELTNRTDSVLPFSIRKGEVYSSSNFIGFFTFEQRKVALKFLYHFDNKEVEIEGHKSLIVTLENDLYDFEGLLGKKNNDYTSKMSELLRTFHLFYSPRLNSSSEESLNKVDVTEYTSVEQTNQTKVYTRSPR